MFVFVVFKLLRDENFVILIKIVDGAGGWVRFGQATARAAPFQVTIVTRYLNYPYSASEITDSVLIKIIWWHFRQYDINGGHLMEQKCKTLPSNENRVGPYQT